MRAAIINPYLNTLGGGERYTLSFAKVLADMGYSVDLEWNDKDIINQLEKRFGIKLNGINVVPDVKKGEGYDLCFWVSDGSIPLLHSRYNILHFQVPFRDVSGRSLINKMKLIRINKIICNSQFTKNIIDREFGVNSVVVYPPVNIIKYKSVKKENIILNVSRFSQLKQSKHQDILIKIFIELTDLGLKNWQLILAGGTEVGAQGYLEELENLAVNYPIHLIKSPDYKEIVDLYSKSTIFWSASGFAEDEIKNPEKVEHFGISVVEAMSAGLVPIVFNAGGHKEIINDKIDGFLWNDKNELLTLTTTLINDTKLQRSISKSAASASRKYSYEQFRENVTKIL